MVIYASSSRSLLSPRRGLLARLRAPRHAALGCQLHLRYGEGGGRVAFPHFFKSWLARVLPIPKGVRSSARRGSILSIGDPRPQGAAPSPPNPGGRSSPAAGEAASEDNGTAGKTHASFPRGGGRLPAASSPSARAHGIAFSALLLLREATQSLLGNHQQPGAAPAEVRRGDAAPTTLTGATVTWG